jgi:hypothetical protein
MPSLSTEKYMLPRLAASAIQNTLHRHPPLLRSEHRRSPCSSASSHIGVAPVCLILLCLLCPSLHSQTIDDGIMLANRSLCAGALYTHDSWSSYWEGTHQRVNGNIGTITTQTFTMAANYGVTSRLDLIVNVPYVWTDASEGVLHGQSGFQEVRRPASNRRTIGHASHDQLHTRPSAALARHQQQDPHRTSHTELPRQARPVSQRHRDVHLSR